jgi:hypothetical protein
MAEKVAGDATHMEAPSQDQKAAYNDHYKMRCYLLHHLISAKTGLTLNWIMTPGNVDERQFILSMLTKTVADDFKPEVLVLDNGYT